MCGEFLKKIVTLYGLAILLGCGPIPAGDGPDAGKNACPADLLAAEGQRCENEDFSCSDLYGYVQEGPCAGCSGRDCNMVLCEQGVWRLIQVSACEIFVDAGHATDTTPLRDAEPAPDVVAIDIWDADRSAPACEPPQHSSDCAEVERFQCGLSAYCLDGVVHASWHEHTFCDPPYNDEIITKYACTTVCQNGCASGGDGGNAGSGEGLVDLYCARP